MKHFDAIVIGTGSAGSTVATTLSEAGKKVAIIDDMPFGGTCSQRGCDPKKVLVGAAEIIARAQHMAGKGITGRPEINWQELMAFKKTFTGQIPANTEQKFADAGIAMFHGTATFLDKQTIQIGEEKLTADHIVLATGAKPAKLGIPGEELLIDSTGFLALESLPGSMVMVGGGYIAFEFAHMAARAGARVTILHRGRRPLEGFDADLVAMLVKATEAAGIRVILEAAVAQVTPSDEGFQVDYRKGGQTGSVQAGLVVHAAGRAPAVEELDPERAGIEHSKKGVKVNDYLQCLGNPAVYACGDVAEKGLPLTPLAGYEGRLVAKNILENNVETFNNAPVPSVVFTIPPLASVGMTEEKARETGKDLTVTCAETSDWYSSKRINEGISGYKTIVDKETGLLLGAHLFGDHSDEVINLFAMAMKFDIPASQLEKTIMAYPTRSSDIRYMF
ncbi:dihydrolipoyl dehydrogenase family protein [Arsenicibacter rosenii]|uniref:Pyridine nucleotide-disulfide oxidoreductase n=1 Tax=Arsenicibacter rosenii TaxID=1750698 RepID=A0A1S2VIF6_9BACT|nr:NAD(P)/FAD-dependent oxidoreductase [Arsenicibacter rosenii]OIN58522.1 pyridine nucleotide-disulfide oxidoreductase [Arsenicibacter rosenii]